MTKFAIERRPQFGLIGLTQINARAAHAFLWRLVAIVVAATLPAISSGQEPSLELRIEVAELRTQLASTDYFKRKAAVEALGTKGPIGWLAVPQLVRCLDDGWYDVGTAAGTTLLKLGPAAVAQSDKFHETNETTKKLRLLYSMDKRHQKVAADLERLFLEALPEAERKQCAAFVAEVRKSPRAALPVWVAVLSDEKAELTEQYFAVYHVTQLGADAQNAMPTLRKIFDDRKKDEQLRCETLDAIAIIAPKDPAVVALLRMTLKDRMEEEFVRFRSAHIMSHDSSLAQAAVPELLFVLKDTKLAPRENGPIRGIAAAALTNARLETEAISILLDVATNADDGSETRSAALKSLGRFGSETKDGAPLLLSCLLERRQKLKLTDDITSVLKIALSRAELIVELEKLKRKANRPEIASRIAYVIDAVQMK